MMVEIGHQQPFQPINKDIKEMLTINKHHTLNSKRDNLNNRIHQNKMMMKVSYQRHGMVLRKLVAVF